MKPLTSTPLEVLSQKITSGHSLDVMTERLSVYAFAKLQGALEGLSSARLIVDPTKPLATEGSPHDRPFRNALDLPRLAYEFSDWVANYAQIRFATPAISQGLFVTRDAEGSPQYALQGTTALSTAGLSLTPAETMSTVIEAARPDEASMFAQQFDAFWRQLNDRDAKADVLAQLAQHHEARTSQWLYAYALNQVFANEQIGDPRREQRTRKLSETTIWSLLYPFQRDGVTAAIDRLERYGGCIIADSVGLGKTFEALAVMMYHQLRNDRILVLAPKRLRENWTLYASNDERNVIADDRLRYDVLNHTDLSRDVGSSGDIDLSSLRWGHYDLVVIDESHNFRNKRSPKKDRETRYDRLMRQVIREGTKTRVLMLSATPVNNRLADLRNQISFITEGRDNAFEEEGIESIDAITRNAQRQFNDWLEAPEDARTEDRLVKRLGFGYFSLLDKLTIARSRKHVVRYYGTSDTGEFPNRRPPRNIKAGFDREGAYPSIQSINDQFRQLHLAAYTPLAYVLPHKQSAYEQLYSQSVRDGESVFKQRDRELSMVTLMRINLLKRLESSVHAFRLTVERQLEAIEKMLNRLDAHEDGGLETLNIEDVEDVEDPVFESLAIGKKVKVLLADVDRIRWRAELEDDRTILYALLEQAQALTAARDAKLASLREHLREKIEHPLNSGNRKAIVFTAFADTASYLYDNLAPWLREEFGLAAALVTGSNTNQHTLPRLRGNGMGDILSAFAPRAKSRPERLADEGEIDLLIATDCISEGQNLQDCDYLVNYDIHWNPVRIIQRFGRIDRLGSTNTEIQLVNFWPDLELEEYINLESRVTGRMKLLNISATGEEDVIDVDANTGMNDLDYRREQLLAMKDSVLDLEEVGGRSLSITDFTLSDFRVEYKRFLEGDDATFGDVPLGAYGIAVTPDPAAIPPGVIFCLRAMTASALEVAPPDYPLRPHFFIYVGEDATVLGEYTDVKQTLDVLRELGTTSTTDRTQTAWAKRTLAGRDTNTRRRQLEAAVASLLGNGEERSVESLFSLDTHVQTKRGVAGVDDFEVVAYLIVVPSNSSPS